MPSRIGATDILTVYLSCCLGGLKESAEWNDQRIDFQVKYGVSTRLMIGI